MQSQTGSTCARLRTQIFCALLALGLQSCAAFSESHSTSAGNAIRDARAPEQFDALAEEFKARAEKNKTNRLINLQEAARLKQLAGHHDQSQILMRQVLADYRGRELGPILTLEDASQGAALFTNDKIIPYSGSDYERVYAHLLQAQNHFALNELDKTLVELRIMSRVQRQAARERDQRVAEAEENQSENMQLARKLGGDTTAQLRALGGDDRAGFINLYALTYAGLLREKLGDDNSALIDYKQALDIAPTNPSLNAIAYHTAKRFDPAFAQLITRRLGGTPPNQARIVLMLERDWVQPRSQFQLAIGGYEAITVLAIPFYNDEKPSPAVTLSLNGDHPQQQFGLGRSHALTHNLQLAANDLSENMAAILVRQFVRAELKYQAQRAANQNFQEQTDTASLLTALFTTVYAVASEQADTRAWLSLPKQIDTAMLFAPPGTHELSLYLNSGHRENINVTVPNDPNAIILLHARVLNGQFSVETLP